VMNKCNKIIASTIGNNLIIFNSHIIKIVNNSPTCLAGIVNKIIAEIKDFTSQFLKALLITNLIRKIFMAAHLICMVLYRITNQVFNISPSQVMDMGKYHFKFIIKIIFIEININQIREVVREA
jgi:hypothetical protein